MAAVNHSGGHITVTTSPEKKTSNIMLEGMSVLLEVNGEKSSFGVVKRNQRVKVGRAYCSLGPLVGAPFGSVFEVQNDAGGGVHLARMELSSLDVKEAAEKEEAMAEGEEGQQRDNRNLVDNNTAQALSAEEIAQLKRAGASGKDIIQALVANSASFHSKTEFSQEKYMRKKLKKYAPRMVARWPSARSVCEAYFSKSPAKTGMLRVDTLALLLSLANVGAYADVLVLDGCGGLPTAAVAERLGGHGTICSAYHGSRAPSIDILRLFNLDAASCASITRASIAQLVAARTAAQAAAAQPATKATANQSDASPAPVPPQPAAQGTPAADVGLGPAPMEAQESAATPAGTTAVGGGAHAVPASETGPQDLVGIPAVESSRGEVPLEAAEEGKRVGEADSGKPEAPFEAGSGGGVSGHGQDEEASCEAARKSPPGESDAQAPNGGGEAAMEVDIEGSRAGPLKGTGASQGTGREQNGSGAAEAQAPEEGAEGRGRGKGQRHGTGEGEGTEGRAGRPAGAELLQRWGGSGFTSLVVAAPSISPLAAAQHLLPLLATSSPFVIYHPHLQPLTECMQFLQSEKRALALQLSEPWLREYQVLPQRSHPHMQMSATGGYLLHGITIAAAAVIPPNQQASNGPEGFNAGQRGSGGKRARPY